MLFRPRTLSFLNLKNKADETVEAPETVSRFFLDKSGKHLLVATESQELYYYSRASKKFRAINKVKGNLVTAVGWNRNANERSTDAIFVGTKKGSLFELCINTSNEGFLNTSIDTYCKLVSFEKEFWLRFICFDSVNLQNRFIALAKRWWWRALRCCI